MIKRKSTLKYYFSVEGETEQWYLEWLQEQINNAPEAACKVSFKDHVKSMVFFLSFWWRKRSKGFLRWHTRSEQSDCAVQVASLTDPCEAWRLLGRAVLIAYTPGGVKIPTGMSLIERRVGHACKIAKLKTGVHLYFLEFKALKSLHLMVSVIN